eukprot:TRINITY_DN2493_c1_g4_i1.p1 TRINITY_DN2493_c1_g4~~TRINITY_DN2493_c1_g4_i1.p1  ORF type:complete len:212 (-),score=43.71 TRINITY_DN2493_c1_g4_i1:101-736(-)
MSTSSRVVLLSLAAAGAAALGIWLRRQSLRASTKGLDDTATAMIARAPTAATTTATTAVSTTVTPTATTALPIATATTATATTATTTTATTTTTRTTVTTTATTSSPSQKRQRPIATGIEEKVTAALAPERLLIHDDSAAHRGHAGVAGSQTPETHFRVEVVSASFQGVSRIERQRMVQGLLRGEFNAGLHALELVCRTPAEDEKSNKKKS